GAGFLGQLLNASPLRHQYFKLQPCALGVGARERDHLGGVVSYGSDLGTVVLDVAVTRDDEPALACDSRNPDLVWRGDLLYGTRWPISLVDNGTRVSRVGHV